MPKIALPAGFDRQKVGVGLLHSGLTRLYHEIRGDEGSFGKDLARGVNEHQFSDSELGATGSMRNVAKQFGLEGDLDRYIKHEVVGGIRGKLGFLLDFTSSLKDSLEDIVEGAELVGTVGAGAASLGAGAVAVQIGATTIEAPLYVVTQTVYSVIAGILGYASGTYELTKKGLFNYISDTAKGYLNVGNALPVIGLIAEWGTNFDDKRARIIDSSSRRAEIWLSNKIREKKGLQLRSKDLDLVDLISSRKAKPKIVDYSPSTPYGADLASGGYSAA